jgi:soluble lytic murein transglycosylase-like protein
VLGVRRPSDPTENIQGGTAYLRQLLDHYGGDEALAPGRLQRRIGRSRPLRRSGAPYRETQDYVRKVGSAETIDGDAPTPGKRTVYKTLEIIDGETVLRY